MHYAIIDIETTGMGIQGNKITEIAIFIHDGIKVIGSYDTLIDPECAIPHHITQLTGITNAMVQGAPKFYEVAKEIIEFTQDCVFVAHNVNFDFNVMHKEFNELDFPFQRKKLCTIRLSKKLIPGLSSYSLGKMCVSQNIVIKNRHRAKGDAEATVILFDKLLALDVDNSVFDSFLKPNSRQGTLPPLMTKEAVDALPETEGVYYFKNKEGLIIYIGKANNIKQRVLSHFYDKKNKEVAMCTLTADVSYQCTGSELLALLLESAEIKHYFPQFNRAQRRLNESYGLFSFEDRDGVVHIGFNKLKSIQDPIVKFYTTTESRVFLEQLCEEFELCPKYCHLQNNVSACFHFQLKKCKGVCQKKESKQSYNARVKEAIDFASMENETYTISQKGRSDEERGFVLVEKGIYKGYGYADKEIEFTSLEEYKAVLVSQKDNRDIQRILKSWKRNEEKRVLEEDEFLPTFIQKWWTNDDLESEKNKKEYLKETVNLSNVGLFGLM
ncbi:MAG: DNA polymerase III subunit epsilon [Flavobacteriaceae bacterium]|nr:MAG: DNA polymerase III subunit epsilon [Flavobacteriaceae bacterium]